MDAKLRHKRDQEGVALLLALLLVVLLGAITFEYAYETQVDASLAANCQGETEAYIAAKSAVAIGMSLLQGDQMQEMYGDNPYGGNQNNPNQNLQNQQGMFGEFDSKWTDAWGQPITQPINDATMHCNIEDECGKLNLNVFFEFSAERMKMEQNPEVPPETNPNVPPQTDPDNPNQPLPNVEERLVVYETVLRNLFDQMEADPNPTDAIIDWIDADDEPRPEGAESDYYESLETPYACKNGPLDSIEELLLVVGVTPEIYFDLNRTPEETAELLENEDELWPVSSLPDLLTAYGSIDGMININTARPELLMAIFEEPSVVENIMAAQMENPFQDAQSIETVVGIPPNMQGLFDVKSNVFRIQGDGFMEDVMVRIEAFVVRPDMYSEIPMPFRIMNWRVIR